MLSLLADRYNFLSPNNTCSLLDIIISIEIFLLTILISVLTIRIALIDNEGKTIREKINTVFDKYGYYGHLLFEKQIDIRINDFYEILLKKNKNQTEIDNVYLDKKKVESLYKQFKSLKHFRENHIEAIKPISIIIILLIISCLILKLLNLDNTPVMILTIKTSIIGTTIYTIYKSAKDILYLFNYPFSNNN